MERSSQTYAKVNALVRGRLRFISDPDAPASFTSAPSASIISREEMMRQTNFSESFVTFLLNLDGKLETILSILRKDSLENDFPFTLETLVISGAGIRFTSDAPLTPNSHVEVILFLGDYPFGLIGAIGKIEPLRTTTGADTTEHSYNTSYPWTLRFTRIREPDLDTIVQFVFQEERRRIREHRYG